MTELTLFGEQPAQAPDLGPRQQVVLDALRAAGHEGLRADEAGAAIHEWRSRHDAGSRCDFCGREGQAVLKRLRELGYARRDRHGNWRAADAPDGGYDPTSAAIPF